MLHPQNKKEGELLAQEIRNALRKSSSPDYRSKTTPKLTAEAWASLSEFFKKLSQRYFRSTGDTARDKNKEWNDSRIIQVASKYLGFEDEVLLSFLIREVDTVDQIEYSRRLSEFASKVQFGYIKNSMRS